MRHHFADFLDRDGDYWTIVPNRQRYVHLIDEISDDPSGVRFVTIEKESRNWERVRDFTNLEEVTLHEPSKVQIEAVSELVALIRLRITHARPKTLKFVESLVNIEELVLEYVSGFTDLAPLRSLTKLKSVHFENLRKVSDFGGLSGLTGLRYLRIDGTLDWKQPIENFEFLRGLPSLEVLSLGQFINRSPFPALLPALGLAKLRQLRIVWTMLAAEECALLEVGLPGVKGTDFGPYKEWNEWYEFTGKGAGRAKIGTPGAEAKCKAYAQKYQAMKDRAQAIISSSRVRS